MKVSLIGGCYAQAMGLPAILKLLPPLWRAEIETRRPPCITLPRGRAKSRPVVRAAIVANRAYLAYSIANLREVIEMLERESTRLHARAEDRRSKIGQSIRYLLSAIGRMEAEDAVMAEGLRKIDGRL